MRLPALRIDLGPGAAPWRGGPVWPTDGSYFPAASAAAEELVAAIEFDPGHTHSGRQLEALQDLSRLGIDAP